MGGVGLDLPINRVYYMGEMRKTYSEIKQEEAGTLYRNRLISLRYKVGITQAELARHYELSRQRINQIVHRSYPKRVSLWGRLWNILTHPY